MREIEIKGNAQGQRLDRLLLRYFPEMKKSFLYKMLRKKNIKLNGTRAEGNEKLNSGDTIQIYFSEETCEKFQGSESRNLKGNQSAVPSSAGTGRRNHRYMGKKERPERLRKEVRILYQDERIMILHKPAGMLTQRAAREDESLNDILLSVCLKQGIVTEEDLSFFRPSIANRLDRNTSGIVLCGLTTEGLQQLSELLRGRAIQKYYLCLVRGQVTGKKHIQGYLRKDEAKNVVTVSKKKEEESSWIETEYEVLGSNSEASLLRVHLITGKSHQIRAHLASIGHPVLGDYKYGNRKINDRIQQKTGVNYQMLHSSEIHVPENAGTDFDGLNVNDPMPEDFRKVMDIFSLK